MGKGLAMGDGDEDLAGAGLAVGFSGEGRFASFLRVVGAGANARIS